jgi:NAD(P)H-flavin reductase
LPSAVLAGRRDAGGGLTLVDLEVDASLARGYAAPGQYIEIRTDRGNGFFVLAGALGLSPWELLVRNAGDAADVVVTAPVGTPLEVSAPLGDGFPADRATGRQLVVAVVGSALAVARPLVKRRLDELTADRTHVYNGARSAAEVPLAEEVEAWGAAGVEVVLCLSKAELEHDRARLAFARRAAGYVQDAVALDCQGGRLAGALVFAAGPAGMLTAMRGLPGSVLEVVTNV